MAAQAERERQRQLREAERAHRAATKEAAQARKAADRARAQFERASNAERKRLEKEAKAAYLEARLSEVNELNAQLSGVYEEIDSMLNATLAVDDHFDLNTLKKQVVHPPFTREDLRYPTPQPDPGVDRPRPELQLPPEPTGLSAMFGKKKHEKAVEQAKLHHEHAVNEWTTYCHQLHAYRQNAAEAHRQAELQRVDQLTREEAKYAAECAERARVIEEHNRAIDQFVSDLGYGSAEAIESYVSIVLERSCYPESFPVEHEVSFATADAELRLRVRLPPPDQVPTIKTYKYTKASDEITASFQSQKVSKDRYANAVHQIALRSIHEVFEADRRGLVKTISLEVGTDTIDPATGNPTYIPFLATAASREAFLTFELANVTPLATLELLGAAVSKNPFGLVPANTDGVRQA